MNGMDAAVYGLRALGAAYLLGGAWISRTAMDRTGFGRPLAELESLWAVMERRPVLFGGVQIDPVWEWWKLLGALLAVLVGAALVATSLAAPVLLALVLLHHILWFARQEDSSPGARVGREVSRRMAAGYLLTLAVAVGAAAVGAMGRLG